MQNDTLCCRNAHNFNNESKALLLKINSSRWTHVGALSHEVAVLAMYQAFWDSAVDIAWVEDERGPALVLTAAMPLQAGWQLRDEQLMGSLPFEGILMDWGLHAAAHAMQGVPLLQTLPHQSYTCCLILRAYPPALMLGS